MLVCQWFLTLSLPLSGIWVFLGVGDTPREHPRSQRLQVHRDERVQRGHHVCVWRRRVVHHQGPAQFVIHHHLPLHHLLHNNHPVPCFYAKGEYRYNHSSFSSSLNMDSLSFFSFQPVLHDWCNRFRGMCYHVKMVNIQKDPLMLIEKIIPCNGGR